ncbi:hypothetical protein [Actinomadura rubrisoli]|uniref:hypothetical protein n=1 Tax=Actinomadura rubrisoli TaxID=2530368 RepID=UPI00140492E5|nr:hypothetical protein [Actinomadura rubrisoli]
MSALPAASADKPGRAPAHAALRGPGTATRTLTLVTGDRVQIRDGAAPRTVA